MHLNMSRQSLMIVLALFCTYFIWGSTYLAIRFGIESFPPFLMGGVRFTVAGVVLFVVMRYLGAAMPSAREWLGAGVVGLLLPALGNGTVCYVQQTVSSSVAALSIATAPIWMAIFSSIWGHKIIPKEWLGIAIGLVGIVLLNLGGSFDGDFMSAFLLIFAAASWSFGSVWGKHLSMPEGLMGAACQMLVGGLALLIVSAYAGESWPAEVSPRSWGALVFLIVLGSLIAYSAYQYLLKTVRPLVASSNTFVNPIVAFAVGIWFASEHVTMIEMIALGVILVGVFLVLSVTNNKDI
ncbi:drug/metabolite exporter YedA [Methylotenera sp. L2L1]|uniref:drug/metabolite exporter YedA n=1 Tax=Methylotenera sp. L2L1 TaxID=1502770 RepID=UPI0005618338|nr:drug/metabolite exporter YedA [Methylotenera sp. L2L1]